MSEKVEEFYHIVRWLVILGIFYIISSLSAMDDNINDLRERMSRLEGLMESHLIVPHFDNTVASSNIKK